MYYIVMYLLSEERLYFSVISCSFKELFSVHEIKKKFPVKSLIFFLTDISIFLHDSIFLPSRLSLKVTKMYSILFQNLHFAFYKMWILGYKLLLRKLWSEFSFGIVDIEVNAWSPLLLICRLIWSNIDIQSRKEQPIRSWEILCVQCRNIQNIGLNIKSKVWISRFSNRD